MSDLDISSDENNGEIRSEDENDLQVIQEPGEGEIFQETENAEAQANPNGDDASNTQTQDPKVKRVRNPQPKLNADRLKGPRGIHTVEDILKKIKFKGRGHEEEDLNNLMRGYEYWCHRLFPKFTFDDCLERIENLGKKREVQTYIKRIRMNLLPDDVDGIESNDEDEETEIQEATRVVPQDDPFDTLVSNSSHINSQKQTEKITEEQLERMRINRERAQRIRMQKMISMRGSVQNNTQESLHEPFDHPHSVVSVVPEQSTVSNNLENTENRDQISGDSSEMMECGMQVNSPNDNQNRALLPNSQISSNGMDCVLPELFNTEKNLENTENREQVVGDSSEIEGGIQVISPNDNSPIEALPLNSQSSSNSVDVPPELFNTPNSLENTKNGEQVLDHSSEVEDEMQVDSPNDNENVVLTVNSQS